MNKLSRKSRIFLYLVFFFIFTTNHDAALAVVLPPLPPLPDVQTPSTNTTIVPVGYRPDGSIIFLNVPNKFYTETWTDSFGQSHTVNGATQQEVTANKAATIAEINAASEQYKEQRSISLGNLQSESQALQNNQTLQSQQDEMAFENELAAQTSGAGNKGSGGGTSGGTSGGTNTSSGGAKSSANSGGSTGGSIKGTSQTTSPDPTTKICNNGTCIYQMLAPIPGLLGDASGRYVVTQDSSSLCSLLNQWFRIGIALAGMLAVVMIVLGGFQYATTDSLFDKSEGKEKIQSALWGLMLALTTWLILSTINPTLTKCELNAPVTELSKVDTSGGTSNGTLGVSTSGGISGGNGETITTAPDGGTEVSVNGVRIDSDGRVAPGYSDPTISSETSYKPGGRSMDATTEAYVVVPMDANGRATVPMGTPALIQDQNTGKQVWAVVGDAGSQQNGWGEMSVYAAVQIGAADGKSDSAANHKIKITYYSNK